MLHMHENKTSELNSRFQINVHVTLRYVQSIYCSLKYRNENSFVTRMNNEKKSSIGQCRKYIALLKYGYSYVMPNNLILITHIKLYYTRI